MSIWHQFTEKKKKKLGKKTMTKLKCTIWIKYSIWTQCSEIVLVCIGIASLVTLPTNRFIFFYHKNTNTFTCFFFCFFLDNKKFHIENSRDKIDSCHLIDIWLWGHLQFNKKNHIIFFPLLLLPFLFVFKKAT